MMLSELNAFYESNGISPLGFRCPSRSACSGNSPRFTEAKASFVGPRYRERQLPRLLFLSLDPGSAEREPERRTAESVRHQEVATDVGALPKPRHWYRTHELAFELLHQFRADLTIADARLYFAHVNSAKCCQNKSKRRQADQMFENCRRFIPGELRILKPDIIVTQGNPAKAGILENFDVREHTVQTVAAPGYKNDGRYETGLLEIGTGAHESLWLHTYLPTAFGHFNPQRRYCWPLYAEAAGRFWRGSNK